MTHYIINRRKYKGKEGKKSKKGERAIDAYTKNLEEKLSQGYDQFFKDFNDEIAKKIDPERILQATP